MANYDFLFLKRKRETSSGQVQTDYAHRINRILNLFYGFLPENGTLCKIDITERKDRNFVNIHIPKLTVRQNHFRSDIEVHEDSTTQHWTTCGKVKPQQPYPESRTLCTTEQQNHPTLPQTPFRCRYSAGYPNL